MIQVRPIHHVRWLSDNVQNSLVYLPLYLDQLLITHHTMGVHDSTSTNMAQSIPKISDNSRDGNNSRASYSIYNIS